MNKIFKLLHGVWPLFIISVTAAAFAILFDFLIPQVIKITVDSIIGEEPLTISFIDREFLRSNLLWCAVIIIFFALLAGICTFVRRTCASAGSEKFVKKLRDLLFKHIQYLPYQWHMDNKTGDIIQRCTSDVDVIREFVSAQLLELCRILFLVTFALVIMFSMNIKMTLFALAFIPIVVTYSAIFYSKISKQFLLADEAEGDLSADIQENLTGVRVVRAFGRERYEIEKFDEKNNKFTELWVKLGGVLGPYWGIGDFFSGLQILLIIVLGIFECTNGNISTGEFLAFIYYNTKLVWPIRGMGRILSEMSKAGVSIERVNAILNAAPETDPPDALTPPMTGDIEFKIKNFAYKDTKPVLNEINLKIESGTTLGILGSTGSGKSTLIHLLDRLYDLPLDLDCGEITIGGVDIRKMKRSWVRKNIGLVLQESFLFSRTIVENIRASSPDASLEEIKSAASIACVDETIENFSAGYETMVGERGVTLSGGQKQRVAIARMLMQKAPIMIFDDSLSAVDSETDAKIRAALNESLEKATIILISHRINSLMRADKIIVLDDGRIIQEGTHEQLIEQEGIYKEIYNIQMMRGDEIGVL
ncbi:MAG: ABC transporter ATP-binding protein/permease [Oscillospiraceae bacterium]|nr:ABC transporter ATP-binding protein/permease [Oscillospiraceae bacterium]